MGNASRTTVRNAGVALVDRDSSLGSVNAISAGGLACTEELFIESQAEYKARRKTRSGCIVRKPP
jgi:hypothetical protein